jgi:hypothetical protein
MLHAGSRVYRHSLRTRAPSGKRRGATRSSAPCSADSRNTHSGPESPAPSTAPLNQRWRRLDSNPRSYSPPRRGKPVAGVTTRTTRINLTVECPRPDCPRLHPTPARTFLWRHSGVAPPAPHLVLVLIRQVPRDPRSPGLSQLVAAPSITPLSRGHQRRAFRVQRRY